jgi:hypothetical protein
MGIYFPQRPGSTRWVALWALPGEEEIGSPVIVPPASGSLTITMWDPAVELGWDE